MQRISLKFSMLILTILTVTWMHEALAQDVVRLYGPMPKYVTAYRSSFNGTAWIINGTTVKIKKVISIVASICYSGQLFPLGAIYTKTMQAALDRISMMPNFLTDYEVVIEPFDDLAARPDSIIGIVKRLNDPNSSKTRIPLVLGPVTVGHLHTGQILRHYNFVGVTSLVTTPELQSNRRKYNGFYVLQASPTMIHVALVQFIQAMGWQKMAILSEVTDYWEALEHAVVVELEKRNMKIQGIFKTPIITGFPPEEKDLAQAVEDLKKSRAKIILINSNTAAKAACWLYRHGLYGPNYVIFLQGMLTFSPTDPSRYQWCNPIMLMEIMNCLFYFGDVAKAEVLPSPGSDSSGFSYGEFMTTVQSRISDSLAGNPFWPSIGTHGYEMIFFILSWLNRTEQLLNTRNETLSDWVTSGEKYQKNGEVFFDLMKDSFLSMKVKALRADYDFDHVTDENTGKGAVSLIGFFQARFVLGPNNVPVFKRIPVAYFNAGSKNSTMVINRQLIVWRTKDGKTPEDSFKAIDIMVPLVDLPGYAALITVGSLIIVVNLGCLVLQFAMSRRSEVLRNSLANVNNGMLVGNCLLVTHVYCLPLGIVPNIRVYCTASYALIIMGGSVLFCSIWVKMEAASAGVFKQLPNRRMTASTAELYRRRLRKSTIRVERRFGMFGIFASGTICILAALCTAWLAIEPLETQITNGTEQQSKTDSAMTTRQIFYSCRMPDAAASQAPLASIDVILGVVFIRCMFIAFSRRSANCPTVTDFALVRISIYLKAVAMFAGVVLGVIFWTVPSRLQLVISALMLAVVTLNDSVIFLPKVFMRGGYIRPLPAATASATAAAAKPGTSGHSSGNTSNRT